MAFGVGRSGSQNNGATGALNTPVRGEASSQTTVTVPCAYAYLALAEPPSVVGRLHAALVSPAPVTYGAAALLEMSGGVLPAPAPALSGYFGGGGEIASPVPAMSIALDIPVVMRGALVSPVPTLAGSTTVGGVVEGATTSPAPALSGCFGGGGEFTSPAPVLSGAGTTGGLMSGVLLLPAPTLAGNVTEEAVMRGGLVSPSPIMAPTGCGWLVSPSAVIHAVMREVIAVTYEAYAINLTTGAVTHYTNYPFDNILRFGDKFYGVSSDGLFEIGGDLDLALPIQGHIKTFQTTFGSRDKKRLPAVYISGRSDSGLTIGVTVDEGVTREYPARWGKVAGSTNHRVAPGKKVLGVYYSFDVKNVNGGSLELDTISVEVAHTTRAI